MEVSAFRGSTPANISPPSLDGKGGSEPDGREHERALVRRAQDGDRDAFGELYRTHLPAVSRLVRFRVGAENEDVVSDVFLRAWRGLASYRDTGVPFAAWLYGIARHVAIDTLRKRRCDPPAPGASDSSQDRRGTSSALRRRSAHRSRPLLHEAGEDFVCLLPAAVQQLLRRAS